MQWRRQSICKLVASDRVEDGYACIHACCYVFLYLCLYACTYSVFRFGLALSLSAALQFFCPLASYSTAHNQQLFKLLPPPSSSESRLPSAHSSLFCLRLPAARSFCSAFHISYSTSSKPLPDPTLVRKQKPNCCLSVDS